MTVHAIARKEDNAKRGKGERLDLEPRIISVKIPSQWFPIPSCHTAFVFPKRPEIKCNEIPIQPGYILVGFKLYCIQYFCGEFFTDTVS